MCKLPHGTLPLPLQLPLQLSHCVCVDCIYHIVYIPFCVLACCKHLQHTMSTCQCTMQNSCAHAFFQVAKYNVSPSDVAKLRVMSLKNAHVFVFSDDCANLVHRTLAVQMLRWGLSLVQTQKRQGPPLTPPRTPPANCPPEPRCHHKQQRPGIVHLG